jgi:hypothetical protein
LIFATIRREGELLLFFTVPYSGFRSSAARTLPSM